MTKYLFQSLFSGRYRSNKDYNKYNLPHWGCREGYSFLFMLHLKLWSLFFSCRGGFCGIFHLRRLIRINHTTILRSERHSVVFDTYRFYLYVGTLERPFLGQFPCSQLKNTMCAYYNRS